MEGQDWPLIVPLPLDESEQDVDVNLIACGHARSAHSGTILLRDEALPGLPFHEPPPPANARFTSDAKSSSVEFCELSYRIFPRRADHTTSEKCF